MFGAAFVGFQQHEELAKDFGEVAAVDLVDDENPGATRVVACRASELVEDTIAAFEGADASRAVALDKVLVPVAGMELDHVNAGVVFVAHEGIGDAAGNEVLPTPGGPWRMSALFRRRRERMTDSCSGLSMKRSWRASASVNGVITGRGSSSVSGASVILRMVSNSALVRWKRLPWLLRSGSQLASAGTD